MAWSVGEWAGWGGGTGAARVGRQQDPPRSARSSRRDRVMRGRRGRVKRSGSALVAGWWRPWATLSGGTGLRRARAERRTEATAGGAGRVPAGGGANWSGFLETLCYRATRLPRQQFSPSTQSGSSVTGWIRPHTSRSRARLLISPWSASTSAGKINSIARQSDKAWHARLPMAWAAALGLQRCSRHAGIAERHWHTGTDNNRLATLRPGTRRHRLRAGARHGDHWARACRQQKWAVGDETGGIIE